jgi:hypothetical protein
VLDLQLVRVRYIPRQPLNIRLRQEPDQPVNIRPYQEQDQLEQLQAVSRQPLRDRRQVMQQREQQDLQLHSRDRYDLQDKASLWDRNLPVMQLIKVLRVKDRLERRVQ